MAANSNPHKNTYNSTRFSGPVKSGSRWFPVPSYDRETVPGTIAATALPNTGYVICSQSAGVKQTVAEESVNNIVLPAGSMILSIQIIVTTVFDATDDKDLSIYCRPESALTWITDYVNLGAVGVYDLGNRITTSATANRWKDVSYIPDVKAGDSVDLIADSGAGGSQTGRAILTINYIPGLHLLT